MGRSDSLQALVTARDSGLGSLILGPHGIGKTALATAVADSSPGFHVVQVHGTAVSSRTPYGALAWLISQLPEDVSAKAAAQPMLVFHKVSSLLRENARGLPVLLSIDNAQHLDESTALVAAQLVRSGEASVIANATDLLNAPAEFFSLWSDGFLRRVDLEPLTMRQTKKLMEQTLAGPVSLRAAAAMWTATEGNPQFILLMTDEQIAAGTLVQTGGVWVAAGPYVRSGAIAEVIGAELARMTEAERRIVEILSFIGSLSLPEILALADADALDSLQEKGTIILSGTALPMVRIHSTTLAAVVTGNVPLGRSRELWEEVTAVLDVPRGLDPTAVPGYVAWSLACDAVPPAHLVHQAARLANSSGENRRALAYARSVNGQARNPDLVGEEVRALMSIGDNHQALSVLQRHESDGSGSKDSSWVSLMLQKAALLRTMPHTGTGTPVWEEIRAHLQDETGNGDPGTAMAVTLAEADQLLAEGDYSDAAAPLLKLVSAPGTPLDIRSRATAMAAEALTMTGQADKGMELLDDAAALLKVPMAAGEQAAMLTRVFYAYFAAGEYQRALDLITELDNGELRWSYRGSAGELAVGLIRAASGQADEALDVLLPGISQLRYRDPENLMPLAAGLTAYAYRLRGETEKAMSYVSMAPRFRHRPYWYPERISSYFRVLASHADSPVQLSRRMLALAEDALSRSNVAFAMFCLAPAASLGEKSAAVKLHTVASASGGRWARTMADYGAGLASGDAALLLQAAQGAAELGHHLVAYRTAGLVRAAGAAATGRTMARTALIVENHSYRKLRRENSLERKMAELNDFETELVHLAAGKMTRNEIAEELSLSPRTIDWHLGKIFDKLHISDRSELKEALG